MQNYHTVFRCLNGDVYTCGLGRGGRLATGSEETSIVPKLVPKFCELTCVQVAAGPDHTLFLMSDGTVSL